MAIPMLNAGYVPQGVAVSSDGTQLYTMSYYTDDNDENPAGGACGLTRARSTSWRSRT